MKARVFSLGVKLAVSTIAVLAVVSSLVFYALAARARTNLVASKRQAAELVSDLFAVSAVAALDFGDDKDAETTLANLRVNREITYAAIWRRGSPGPIASTGRPPEGATVDAEPRSETRLGTESLDVVRRIDRADGTALGAVLIRFSLASVLAELQDARRGMLFGIVGTAALIGLLILAVARWQIVAPLERLVVAARRLEAGEQGVTVDAAAQDEMGRLAGAFNTMSAAIVDRERHLADAMARLRELFDNMRQGIVVFGRDGRIDEAPSKQASVLFGPDVAGRAMLALLYGDDIEGTPVRQAFEEWLAMSFDVPPQDWADFATLAPTAVERTHDGDRQWLELQFTPVVVDGRVSRIMMLATDVSDQRRLERAAQTREQQHAREMGAMRRLVAGGGQVFASFLESADERIAECETDVNADGEAVAPAALGRVFERVHTIRGEARTFDLPELASECQGLERTLRELRDAGTAPSDAVIDDIAARLGRTRAAVARARDMFVEASPIGSAVLDQMTVRRSDLAGLAGEVASADEPTRRALERLTSRPFGECVTAVVAAAPRWAEEVGKQVRVVIRGREVRIPARVAPTLRAMLPHVVRNAIAHGIEDPERRRAAGKHPEGTLRLTATEESTRLVVVVQDDGAGLDDAAIVAQARRLGLPDAPAWELLFAAGLSTAARVGELAGQGVGLGAVREGLRGIGADIGVRSEDRNGASFEIVVPFASRAAAMKG